MKGLILSGGSGKRMRPITHTSPKQLVPVANKPVLFYGLEAIAETGIREVGIVVGDTATEIMSAVGTGAQFGLEVTYIHQDAPRGLAHAVSISRDYLGDDNFVMYLGDNFIVGGITALVNQFQAERPAAQVALTHVASPSEFGIAELNASGAVIGLQEKPQAPKSDLAVAGIYMFTPHIYDAIRELKPSERGELEITDAIQWLIDSGYKVSSNTITGYWKDTGNVTDMLEVNRLVLEKIEPVNEGSIDSDSALVGRVNVAPDARIEGSRIVGPAIIGHGSVVIDSYIGPFTSVAADCLIAGSEVEYSIILRGASIRGVHRISGSLIGHEVEVAHLTTMPRAHSLVLGDHSSVQINI
jgi:glucose-1-phosphate thymidylyltransferase